MRKGILLPAVAALYFSCGSPAEKQSAAPTEAPPHGGWKMISEKDFTVQYPPTWTLDQSGQYGSKFFLFSQVENDSDKFKENINLITQELNGQRINLDQYAELSKQQLSSMITNAKIL